MSKRGNHSALRLTAVALGLAAGLATDTFAQTRTTRDREGRGTDVAEEGQAATRSQQSAPDEPPTTSTPWTPGAFGATTGQTGGPDGPESSGFPYGPSWTNTPPSVKLAINYDTKLTPAQNGAALKTAIAGLTPGDRLIIGPGTYSVESLFSIDLVGTQAQPIWITGARGAKVVITRSNASQNVINIGQKQAQYVCLRGLEITGGSAGIKLYNCQNVWIDICHVHHTGEAAITANSADTAWLYITRNTIHNTAGAGEGMYLGANNGQWIMSHSVIARNHVYLTSGVQGDGIEVKQGSFDNRIIENLVHDTHYPAILVYGTNGQAPNLVERNVCFNSGDNVMQVQGEAIVRNNLIMNGSRGFASHDHQGTSRDLVFVHNTIINGGSGAHLQSWDSRPGMVFANNVVYSQSGDAVRFANGSTDVHFTNNIVLGPVHGASSGWSNGNGLSDFVDITWDAMHRDAHPSPAGALIATGHTAWGVVDDLDGIPRAYPLESGCLDDHP